MFFLKIWNKQLAVLFLACPFLTSTPMYAQNAMGESQGSITTFQIAGSSFTGPAAINNTATVAGRYFASGSAIAGFVRAANGTFASFSIPGAVYITPTSMNQAGVIAGQYSDSDSRQYGFVRAATGAITTFGIPGQSGQPFINSSMINDAGTIAGTYTYGAADFHGFVRAATGAITTFDPAESTGTIAEGINDLGAIVGNYTSTTGIHGFLRYPSGAFVTFDPPGSKITLPSEINASGAIVGVYATSSGYYLGFIRSNTGIITTFDVGTNGQPHTGLGPLVINAVGIVAGNYEDASFMAHGFVRTTDGVVTVFDPAGSFQTTVSGIDDFGAISGSYDVGSSTVGFIRYPTGGETFQPGAFDVADGAQFYFDGGFYLYGDPTVRLWTLVPGNANQHWHFGEVAGGFTLLNLGTGQYASDQSGVLHQGPQRDVWKVTEVPEGYSIRNNRTGGWLTDGGVDDSRITLTRWGSVWQLFPPK